ncbi:MAG: Rossmann fold nucleotide-binding protein Smf possibly involved in DNA uptake [uncultured Rubrobacteraceae bacterium]|uniref:Rossmann fold nucleotide-binding protein Smf possibly involved in DNA uptake n=1 Tax=uncultured Rubrobacteraceae bacterium TaxID=349277 RepID=A0A6J4NTY6_9ACTN|nr:MAG: Rossmann fold nucleotide-binding protein Smf possibly involved in DNA uptake [uncultured Rubrobacteraceae bacterium]
MKVYGLDFTSAPARRKPLVALRCTLEEGTLRLEDADTLTNFEEFEAWLETPGPWVCGMDFPFGQPRDLVKAMGWRGDWSGYVDEVARLGKEGFEGAVKADMASRPYGEKWRYRLADRRSGSSSAMMLFRVPVGKMFFQGAPRLLRSGVAVEPCRPNGDPRVAVEAYPAVVARRFLGREPYKRDAVPDTPGRMAAREKLVAGLRSDAVRGAYGFGVSMGRRWRERFVEEPGADALDSLLCAIQAAWAYTRREDGWGVPPECDRNEGWIVDPALLES